MTFGLACAAGFVATDVVAQPNRVGALVAAGGELRVNVAEAVGGKTVFGQLAVDRVTRSGVVTAYGCDDGIPKDAQGNINKADLNYNGNVTPVTSNRLIVKADNDGDICFYTSSPAEMIIDINGTTTTGVTAITNQRTDTRANTGSGPLALMDLQRGPTPTGCAPSTLADTTRVSIDPRIKALLAGVNWSTVDELTIGRFWNALGFGYHETMHAIQNGDGAMTGSGQGYGTPRLGPPQSDTNADVRSRSMAIIPDSNNFCRQTALSVADTYLTGSIATQGIESQLWEINAYVLDMEFESPLLASTGTDVWGNDLMNTYTQSPKLHQLARYLQLAKATPGLWDQMRAAGIDRTVADHWNLAGSTWRPLTNGLSQQGCWDLAFGPDASVISEFTGGLAGTIAPPRP